MLMGSGITVNSAYVGKPAAFSVEFCDFFIELSGNYNSVKVAAAIASLSFLKKNHLYLLLLNPSIQL
eukprot:m.116195 g.116195  ORF g.116195 m.116195 type:complete len:67 (+) comp9302_c0_seq8:1236-1436(+)